jgi:lipopolysaccharide heptosyltransferase II
LKILLVRLRMIGDVVFTTPAIAALHARFPNAHLTYIVEPAAAPVVAGNPCLAEVIVAPRQSGVRGLLADLALARRLSRQRFHLAIDFHGGPRASLLTWLSGATRRVGYDIAGRGWMYTERVRRPRELRARHSVENQWDLLAAVGIAPPTRTGFPVQMAADPGVRSAVRDRLTAHGVPDTGRVIVMHVSASNPFRRWPAASFSRVAATIAARHADAYVLVTSGPSEADAAARVIDAARQQLPEADRSRIVACGEFSLAELRGLVELAVLYIGGDSGPMHIAATSRVPMVSLYGPTLPARSEPWRDPSIPHVSIETTGLPCRPCDQRVCEPGDFRCLGRITPADVVDAAERLLRRSG